MYEQIIEKINSKVSEVNYIQFSPILYLKIGHKLDIFIKDDLIHFYCFNYNEVLRKLSQLKYHRKITQLEQLLSKMGFDYEMVGNYFRIIARENIEEIGYTVARIVYFSEIIEQFSRTEVDIDILF